MKLSSPKLSPLSRRDLLLGGAAFGALTVLPGCTSGGAGLSQQAPDDNASPGNLTEPASFDYPLCYDLPFAHGVASGDPLSDRVIIWTRITESTPSASSIPVTWEVSDAVSFTTIVRTGIQNTVANRDWTVKVDVTGLSPATTYYYRFRVCS